MTATKPSRKMQPKSISHGRPPTVSRPAASLSAKATRTLIRSHHQLHKARAQALVAGDEALVKRLDQQIAANGGLESYQLASKKGQSIERGGDSSKVLVEWLDLDLRSLKNKGVQQQQQTGSTDNKLRLLEVGALSTQNACSKVGVLDVTRIDLNSQEKGILQQDFMERPLPTTSAERFHIISLSLVLNYVSDPAWRGEMLRRTVSFLEHAIPLPAPAPASPGSETAAHPLLPCLFLVLPAACVLNSRYFTEERLADIMATLGYTMQRRKVTSKLIFYLWSHNDDGEETSRSQPRVFRKDMLNPGATRNNFTVTLGSSKKMDIGAVG
ncbi:hypothetical protein AJ80_07168 [Polytolypa hystricis UAMH7299]|uniref:25S rRNA adenine-N(1) methyltransferase n=1 Tax=Polytolypa hystricis (strain UAMH7299) TaxID=1447883 RepID=A0A2B7XSC4_POLH7|nr:hypothetical protein AJ80_07168 [Polytolypa hystricis UAMH7299]